MSAPNVTRAELEAGLRAVGLAAGDLVFVHASLSAFGRVEGGAKTVVEAVLAAIGPEGTLVAPIFRTFFTDGPDQVWDLDRSPSLMGAVTEAVRTWPGALRSKHAIHPIAAVGPLAWELTEPDNTTDFSFDSPFSLLLEWDARILLLGVTLNRCTMVHVLEERLLIPYRRWVTRTGTVIQGDVSRRMDYPFLERYPGVENDFTALQERLEAQGLVRKTTVGAATLSCFSSRDLYETGYRAICADPLFLISDGTKAAARPYLRSTGAELDTSASAALSCRAATHPVAHALSEVMVVPTPAAAPTMEVEDRWAGRDGLILEQVRVHDGLGDEIPGMLAFPANASGRLPVAVCLHGTWESWEQMMERRLTERGTSLYGWPRELARRGFAVLVITQRGHPPRRESWDWEWPKLLLPYGRSAMGCFVADVAACVDVLSKRPEIDPSRIAIGGYSLGGIIAFYSFAVDARLRACFTFCGGVGSVRTLIREGTTRFHSPYYYIPRLLSEGLDHDRIAEACAPRPLFVIGAEEDAGMPASAVRAFGERAVDVYRRAGAAEKLRVSVHGGPHRVDRAMLEEAAAWLPSAVG